MPDLATLGGVCAYDRANTGASDGVETPRSLSEAVTDLRALAGVGRRRATLRARGPFVRWPPRPTLRGHPSRRGGGHHPRRRDPHRHHRPRAGLLWTLGGSLFRVALGRSIRTPRASCPLTGDRADGGIHPGCAGTHPRGHRPPLPLPARHRCRAGGTGIPAARRRWRTSGLRRSWSWPRAAVTSSSTTVRPWSFRPSPMSSRPRGRQPHD